MLLLPLLEKVRVMNEEEKKVVNKMITLFCNSKHKTNDELCDSCSELNDYAFARLERCPFGEGKPTCGSCSIHCYKPEKKDQIKKVMQFSGPRMLLVSPIYTILHFYKEYKRKKNF